MHRQVCGGGSPPLLGEREDCGSRHQRSVRSRARTRTHARTLVRASTYMRAHARAHTRVYAHAGILYMRRFAMPGVPTPGVHCMTGGSSKMGSIRSRQRGGTALYHPPLPPPPLLVLVYCRGCAVPLQKMCHSTRSDEARQAACCPALSTETTESDATRRDESGRQRR